MTQRSRVGKALRELGRQVARAVKGPHLDPSHSAGLGTKLSESVRNPLILGGAALGVSASAAVFRLAEKSRQKNCAELVARLQALEAVTDVAVNVSHAITARRLLVQVQSSYPGQAPELLTLARQVLKIAWDYNPVGQTPIDLQVRSGETEPSERRQVDAKDLEFENFLAYPHELYERFGAPASDPTWRP